jgi:membrane protease YdiL (CAAX protease family)
VSSSASTVAVVASPLRERRPWLLVLGVLAVLAVMKGASVLIGTTGTVAVGVLGALGVVAVTRMGRLDWHDLGVSRQALRQGLLWSIGFFGLFAGGFALVMLLAHLLPPLAQWVQGLEVQGVVPGSALYQALVAIPLGTVLVEEVAFRSALPALLGRAGAGTRTAIVSSATLFGLWHVAPSLTTALEDPSRNLPVWVVVAGTVVFTTAAGVGLGWLRHRSGSLLPPMLVHLATNSLGVVLLWTLTLG